MLPVYTWHEKGGNAAKCLGVSTCLSHISLSGSMTGASGMKSTLYLPLACGTWLSSKAPVMTVLECGGQARQSELSVAFL